MVKSYLRHGPTQAFGVITSPTANSSFDGRLAYVPAWEDVLVWDAKKGEQVSMWHSPGLTSPITYLAPSPASPSSSSSSSTQRTFAVAYNDGSIRLWAYGPPSTEATELVTFNGHKKQPTHLVYSASGDRLASGGTEGEIIIWDILSEVGLYRLRGHRAPITGLAFLPHPTETAHPGYLLSTARDTFLKLWDLSTQHCLQTVVVGRTEVWSLSVKEEKTDEDDELLSGSWTIMTGSGEGQAKVWSLEQRSLVEGMKEGPNGELPTIICPLCVLPLPPSTQPVSALSFHPSLPLIFLQTSDKAITVLRIRPTEEIEAKRARKKKREREKGKKGKKGVVAEATDDPDGDVIGKEDEIKWEERVAVWCIVRTDAKIRSFSFPEEESSGSRGVSLLVQNSNNSLDTYLVPSPTPSPTSSKSKPTPSDPTKTHSVDLPGHRSDVRALCLSSDDQLICSASHGTLKLWNARTTQCLRTIECGYALCASFLPGDRHVVVGLKSGGVALYDVQSSTLLQTYSAHSGPVWGLHVKPDGKGMVTGSADKDVKFWEFEMREVEEDGEKGATVDRLGRTRKIKTKQLYLSHVRTLKMTDDVLAVKYSPDNRLLAVALLDSTVKVFFQDTLKFFLSLYGHKLPVLSLDISPDSRLIATASSDKNVKIWGLDFGDCHRSIFAHDDSIMQVLWEKPDPAVILDPREGRPSRCFWTVGKDRGLKYWDGDKFDLIQALPGHQGEIWALAVSNRGRFVVTGSHDKSIRVWEKTDEPLFLEEERERELEAQFAEGMVAEDNNTRRPANGADGADGVDEDEVEAVRKATAANQLAGERILEALDTAAEYHVQLDQWMEERTRVPGLNRPALPAEVQASGKDLSSWIWDTVRSVPAAALEDTLLVLPFRAVAGLLGWLDRWSGGIASTAQTARETDDAESDVQEARDPVLLSRLLTLLLTLHSRQLSASPQLRPTLLSLRSNLRAALERERGKMGYNLAGLKFLKGRWESERVAGLGVGINGGEDGLEEVKGRMGKKKKGEGKRKRVVVV